MFQTLCEDPGLIYLINSRADVAISGKARGPQRILAITFRADLQKIRFFMSDLCPAACCRSISAVNTSTRRATRQCTRAKALRALHSGPRGVLGRSARPVHVPRQERRVARSRARLHFSRCRSRARLHFSGISMHFMWRYGDRLTPIVPSLCAGSSGHMRSLYLPQRMSRL